MEINTPRRTNTQTDSDTLSQHTYMSLYVHIVVAAVNPRSIIIVITSKCHCTRAAIYCIKNSVYRYTGGEYKSKQQPYRMSDGTPIERYISGRQRERKGCRDETIQVESRHN